MKVNPPHHTRTRWLLFGALLCASLMATSPAQAALKAPVPPTSWWSNAYLVDWAVAAGLAGGGLAAFTLIPPIEREWAPGDTRLGASIKDTILPHPTPLFVAFGAPLLVFALAQIGPGPKGRSKGHDFHHAALGLTESFALTIAITGMLQVVTGKLRPDWRARCQPDIESLGCTGDAALINEGRRSFPNQSTAYAFAGATFLALYLTGKLKLFDGHGAFWKVPLILGPIAAATLLAVQRVTADRAHPEDVLIGALIGALAASIGYFRHFESPFLKRAGIPFVRLSLTPAMSPTYTGLALQGSW